MHSFPLLKFSWTTDPIGATSFSWKHTNQDLICVFDNFRTSSSSQNGQMPGTMKVLQRENTLELVDITEKTQLARQAIESAKSFGYEVKQDQLPISGLFRAQTHTIAIRYILLDQQVRLQMKFSTLEHYQQVLSCLQALDCCLANADQPAPELHATTVQHQPKSTAISVPVATKPTSRGRKTSAKQRRTSSTKQTNIDNTVGNGPNLVPSDSTYNSNPGQINFLSSGPLSGNSTRPLLPDFQAQSSTTSMISRQLSQNRPSSIRSRPTSALPTITEIPETPSSMLQHSSAMTGLEENVGVSATPVVPMPEIAMNMPPSRWPSANRGLGTTTFLQMVEDLSGQIPPRRELPFDRPSSAPQRQHVVLEPTRPLTVTGMEFTEPYRGLYGENTTDASIIPGPSTHHDGAARPQPILTEKPRQPEGFPNALRPTMAPSSKRKAVEPLSDGPSSAVQPLPPPYSSRPGTAALSSPTEPLAALGNLAGFNALPSQRRDSLMEDAIIQCLKDDNFVDFCEHFEGMWQRIGLDIHQSRR